MHNNVRNQPAINIIEVSNVYPTNLVKHNLHAKRRKLSAKICNETININGEQLPHKYIKLAFEIFQRGYIFMFEGKLHAVCIWSLDGPYIHSVDSKRVSVYRNMCVRLMCGINLDYQLTHYILDNLISYCNKTHIRYIQIYALNDEITNYCIRDGFTQQKSIYGDKFLYIDLSKYQKSSKIIRMFV